VPLAAGAGFLRELRKFSTGSRAHSATPTPKRVHFTESDPFEKIPCRAT
jgi:hypothetical protein